MSTKQKKGGITRRIFGKILAAGGGTASATAALGCASDDQSEGGQGEEVLDGVPLPPNSDTSQLKVLPTACDYCIVGCGFHAYVWPQPDQGTEDNNGLGVDFPVGPFGRWISPNMHTVVEIDGKPHNVVVMPDQNEVVNKQGDHSVRGGTLAQKLYSKDRDTRERLQQPQLRVDGELVDISWDDALAIVAELSRHVIDTHGEAAWAMKMFSYQYYENTYALTKLALDAVATPAWALHDKPSEASDTPGLSDAGINAFSAAYQDWQDADVIFVSGVSLYAAKSILFQDWVVSGGAKLIVVNPRKDLTAAYAVEHGGMHLQIEPGTDTVLNNAIARHILENGWQDSEFIDTMVASRAEIDLESSFRREEFAVSFAEYEAFLASDDAYTLDGAAAITGVPAADIAKAAHMMVEPIDGTRPKTSLMLEKGNYWSHNYDNTASLVSLGLLVGAGNRPGRMISRAGGHQRGMIKGGEYPKEKSPDEYKGNKLALNLDRWVAEGKARMAWAVGTTWFAAMGSSQSLAARVEEQIRGPGKAQVTSGIAFSTSGSLQRDAVIAVLRDRIEAGGLFFVDQDIYPNVLSTQYADLVLPAATWGESDFARMQGERRLRIYSKIMDPPGQAKPDWWIAAEVAKRMGYSGFDWPDANAVFEEASAASVGTVHDYEPLVEAARANNMSGHEYLRGLDTEGIQCPITRGENGELVGTVRLHENGFGTASGKAILVRGSWERVKPVQDLLAPVDDELWVTNMRVNALWQSLADDARIPFRAQRYPANILEIHPDDATARGIESGDWVEVKNDKVVDQLGQTSAGSFRAIAYVTNEVRQGVTCSYFNYRGRLDMAANSVVSGTVDPVNQVYRYKLGKGRVTGLGPSELKDTMTFAANNLVK